MTITHLVLDLGGVVCRWLPDRRLAALSQLSGLPTATVDQVVFESGFDDAGERGRFTLDEFTATLASLLDLDPGQDHHDALAAAWAEAYDPMPAVLRAARRVPARLAMLTNNGPLMEHVMGTELAETGAEFDDLLFSWRLGAAKPEPAAFAAATERLDADPAHVLFVDDSQVNVDAAADFGWQALRFTSALDLQAALDGRT